MLTWKEKYPKLAPIPVHSKYVFYEETWYLEANADNKPLLMIFLKKLKKILMIMALMG